MTHSGFERSNDVSNYTFNPVVSKIENFMAQKDRRNSDLGLPAQNRLSFLSIRNLWINPNGSTVLDRSQHARTS